MLLHNDNILPVEPHFLACTDRGALLHPPRAGVSVPSASTLSARYKLEFDGPQRLPQTGPYLPPGRGSFSGFVRLELGEHPEAKGRRRPTDSWLVSASIDFESSYLGATDHPTAANSIPPGNPQREARGYIAS